MANSTITVVTADHGEYFLERGRFFHARDVYDALVHVPLLIAGALPDGLAGTVVSRSVEIRSIPATVMGIVSSKAHHFAGEDLLRVVGEDAPAKPAFTEGSYATGEDERKRAVVFDGWKLIHNFDDESRVLYDLRRDPGETDDLFDSGGNEARQMRAVLSQHLSSTPAGSWGNQAPKVELGEAERLRLHSLGYVE